MKNQKGFTLVELIVVIVIIGILAAIAIPKFADLSDSAKAAACKQNQAAIESAAAIFYADKAIDPAATAAYPAAISDLVPNYLPDTPTCPDGASTYALGTDLSGDEDGTVSCPNTDHVR